MLKSPKQTYVTKVTKHDLFKYLKWNALSLKKNKMNLPGATKKLKMLHTLASVMDSIQALPPLVIIVVIGTRVYPLRKNSLEIFLELKHKLLALVI